MLRDRLSSFDSEHIEGSYSLLRINVSPRIPKAKLLVSIETGVFGPSTLYVSPAMRAIYVNTLQLDFRSYVTKKFYFGSMNGRSYGTLPQ